MRLLRAYWRYLVAAAALTMLVASVGLRAMLTVIAGAEPVFLVLYVAGLAAIPVFYGLQLRTSFASLGFTIGTDRVVRAAIGAWSIGLLTPARVGDLSLAVFVWPEVPGPTATAVVVLDKALSVVALAVVAALTSLMIDADIALAIGVVGAGLVAVVGLFGAAVQSKRLATVLVSSAPGRLANRVSAILVSLRVVSRSRDCLMVTASFVVARWAFIFCLNMILFRSIGASPGWLVVMAATAVGRLVALVPISIGGAGLKEPFQIMIYATGGVSGDVVIAASVLGLALTYLTAAVLPLAANRGQEMVRAT